MKLLISVILIFALPLPILAQQGVGDLVFCIDASSSMRLPLVTTLDPENPASNCASMLLPIYDPSTRYQKMRLAIDPTINALAALYSTPQLEFSPAWFASVHFPHGTAAAFMTTNNRSLDDAAGNPFTLMLNTLNTVIQPNIVCSSYGTPLGTALNQVYTILTAHDNDDPGDGDTINENQVVILLSDGESTESPDPLSSSTFWTHPGNHQYYQRVYAIGIGDDDNHYEYLNTIATETGGSFFGWWENQTSVYGIYGSAAPGTSFNSGLSLWSLEFDKQIFKDFVHYHATTDPPGIIQPNEVIDQPFQVTPLDSSLIIAAKWAKRGGDSLVVSLILPSGTEVRPDSQSVTKNFLVAKGSYYIYFILQPQIVTSNLGQWRLRLNGQLLSQPTDYVYSIFTRSPLTVETGFPRMSFATGDILNGWIRTTYPGGSVQIDSATAYVLAPQNWIGNWNAAPAQRLTQNEMLLLQNYPWPNDVSVLERMRILRRARGLEFPRLYQRARTVVRLFDDGLHLDGAPNDGVYNNALMQLKTPGLYEVLYSIHGKTSAGRSFQRELYFHKFVSLAADTEKTTMEFGEVSRRRNTVTADVTVTVRDQYGNVALPGHGDTVKINAGHAVAVNQIQDQLYGTYTQRFRYDENLGRPKIGLQYGSLKFPPRKMIFTRFDFIPILDLLIDTRRIFFDKALPFEDAQGFEASIGRYLTGRLRLEGAFEIAKVEDGGMDTGTFMDTGLSLTYDLIKSQNFAPYLRFGGSYLKFKDLTTNDDGGALTFGAGIKFMLWRPIGISIEGTDDLAFGLYGENTTHNLQIRFGFSGNFSKRVKVEY
jgi:hypothetical protein